MSHNTNNPLINYPALKYDAVPFDQIRLEHFEPAVKLALDEAEKGISAIEENPENPSFENTILALEYNGESLGRVMRIYGIISIHESDNEFKDLAQKLTPAVSAFGHRVITSKKLFLKVEQVYQNRDNLGLNNEQKRLVWDKYHDFINNGVHLDESQQKELKTIKIELGKLTNQFSQNMLNSTNAFEYTTEDESELAGIPDNAKTLMAQTAAERGNKGSWTILLQRPFINPVLSHAKNRKLRELVSTKNGSIAYGDEYDNQEIILKKTKLFYRMARILGHDTYAEHVLQNRMAESAKEVKDFLDSFYRISKPLAMEEKAELEKFAFEMDGITELRQWDFSYYTEKLKQKRFGFDSEELRPFFKMENVINGVFTIGGKLYGLKFKEVDDVPVFHPSVKTYEVRDDSNGYLGLLMLDLYPRKTKRNGGWSASPLSQGLSGGKNRRPIILIGANLMPSTDDNPSLLSLGEVRTIFHEFGHALHDLLSQCQYVSLSGTSVYWDFVELPSQIMENWVYEKEALDLFAMHYETGEKLEDDLIEKVRKSQKFMAGWDSMRRLNLEYLDFAWYAQDPTGITDVLEYETRVGASTRLLDKVKGTCRSCSFSHIFAGGYAMGYYSYRWAEALDADAFELFKERGIFNRDVARSFRENILSRGDTAHPMDLYIKFRGHKPDPEALMRRRGLLPEKG